MDVADDTPGAKELLKRNIDFALKHWKSKTWKLPYFIVQEDHSVTFDFKTYLPNGSETPCSSIIKNSNLKSSYFSSILEKNTMLQSQETLSSIYLEMDTSSISTSTNKPKFYTTASEVYHTTSTAANKASSKEKSITDYNKLFQLSLSQLVNYIKDTADENGTCSHTSNQLHLKYNTPLLRQLTIHYCVSVLES